MFRKLLSVLVLLSAFPSVASAREPSGLWRLAVNYYRSLTAPKPYLDSACVYQPRLVWALGPDVNVIRAGVDLHSDITVTDLRDGNATQTGGTMDIGMRNHLCRKVGLDVAYGSLGLGYGVEVGNRGAARNTYFSFGITATCYGAQIQYFKTNQHASGSLALEREAPVDLTTANPGQMRNLSLNAFYAFNRRRFVYNAAYTGRIRQRRSSGSWLVTAKYLQGDFSIDPSETAFTERLNGLNRYTTQQISLGGGYSYNWVLFHRDPYDPDTDRGLRNLTANATLLPMLSFLKHVQTEQGNDAPPVRYAGQPTVSPTVRGALCYSWDRYNLILQGCYNRFGFRGAGTEVEREGGYLRTTVRTRGVFYDLNVKLQLSVRF